MPRASAQISPSPQRRFAGRRAVNCPAAALGGGSSCSPLRQACGRAMVIARRLVTRPAPLRVLDREGRSVERIAGVRRRSDRSSGDHATKQRGQEDRRYGSSERRPATVAYKHGVLLRSRWTRWPKVVADHPGSGRSSVIAIRLARSIGSPTARSRVIAGCSRPASCGDQATGRRRSARRHLRRVLS